MVRWVQKLKASVIDFVEKCSAKGGWAAIASLQEADNVVAGEAGALIQQSENGKDFIEFYKEISAAERVNPHC